MLTTMSGMSAGIDVVQEASNSPSNSADERVNSAFEAITVHSVDDLCRFLRNHSASPLLKARKLAAAYKQIDFYDEEEVRRVAGDIPREIVDAVKKMNPKDAGDITTLMSLGHMINEFFGEFELEAEVLDALAAEIAVIIDPRQYDTFRWHSSVDAHNDYIDDRKKMITRCLSTWMQPRMTALLDELSNNVKEIPSQEKMHALTDYFQKYESMFIGFEQYEYKTPRWKTASAFLERLMRTEHLAHFPRYIHTELAQQVKWMIKMFTFEWTDRRFEMLLTVFTFASIQIYGELDKHEDITEVDCETLKQWAFVIEVGVWYMDQVEAKKEERWLSDEEMIQCLQQMDKGLFYMCDYVIACLDRGVEMKPETRLIILNCYSKFAQHGNVVQIEKKYGKRLTEWMYQNARHLLASVDDDNCQMVVHAVEALLVNATDLTDMPTEVCLLLADYVKFDYVECLKGIDIDREGTFYASRDLLKRDDWYTVEGLRRVIAAAHEKMARMSTIQTQQTKSMVDELQKKLERAIQSPPATSTTA